MARDDPEVRDAGSLTRWTPRRTKLAGLGGIVGGAGGLLASLAGLGAVGFPVGDTGVGVPPGAVILLYPAWNLLFAVAVLAANAQYGSSYGRRGRLAATVLALALVAEAGSILVLVVGRTDLGALLIPLGVLHGAIWLTIRLLGSLYGIGLLQVAGVSRLAAGSFVVLFPAIFVLGPLTQVGFPGVLIPAPLYLAFVALGYELWTAATGTASRRNGVTE